MFCAEYVEAYITHLYQTGLGVGALQSTLSAFRHYCKKHSWPVNFDTGRLALLIRGINRTIPANKRATNAINPNHLRRLFCAADLAFDSRIVFMIKAMFSLAFFGLLRPCEMALSPGAPDHHLLRSNILLKKNSIVIKFSSFKHSTRPVSISVKRLVTSMLFSCPWAHLNNYLCNFSMAKNEPLFNCTIAQANSWLQRCTLLAGIKSPLGLHSFRRGGATWFSNEGMSEAKLKALGRWKSNAFYAYVKAL